MAEAWDFTTDLVIVGSGGGLVGALAAALPPVADDRVVRNLRSDRQRAERLQHRIFRRQGADAGRSAMAKQRAHRRLDDVRFLRGDAGE